MQDRITILGVPIDNMTLEETVQKTRELIETSKKTCQIIVAPNTEFIMTAQKDKEFYEILKQSKLATPDSVGIMLGGKLQKQPFKERIPGQSYFREIFKCSEKEGWTIYLLGGKGDVPIRAKQKLEQDFPKARIVGVHEGYFEQDSEEEVINEINKLKPNVLFVAMGAPKQEKWIYKNKDKLEVDVAAGQGGTFDYEAGEIPRAPLFFQKLGIEWLWRLMKQPSRIIRMMALPKYLIKILLKKDKTKGNFDK